MQQHPPRQRLSSNADGFRSIPGITPNRQCTHRASDKLNTSALPPSNGQFGSVPRTAWNVFAASSSDGPPAEAKFPTVRYLAAHWIGCEFKTSPLPAARLDCTGWRVSSEMGGGIIVRRFIGSGGITLQRAAAYRCSQHLTFRGCVHGALSAAVVRACWPELSRP